MERDKGDEASFEALWPGSPRAPEPEKDLPSPGGEGGEQTPPRSSPPREGSPRSTLRAWIAVVVVAVLVASASAVGAGLAVAAAISSHNTSVIAFSPNTSVFAHMTDVKAVLARVLPSVVTIEAEGPSCSAGFLRGAIVVEEGTGMILTRSGEILTNNHVIANATEIKVTLYGDKHAYPATLVGTDPQSDVALLQLHGPSRLPAVALGAGATRVGEDVLAIGNALALSQSTPSVTEGIISAENRSIKAGGEGCAGTESLKGLLQTQAAINSGNSGGPLVDSGGQVIAMSTAAATTNAGDAPTQNIGFAIPIVSIQKLLEGLRSGGTAGPLKAFLGVAVETVSAASGLGVSAGAVVVGQFPGSPAQAAGIRVGDVVVSFAGHEIKTALALTVVVGAARPGEKVSVVCYRGSRRFSFTVTLGTRPAPEPGAS